MTAQPEEQPPKNVKMVPCSNCGRGFASDRIERSALQLEVVPERRQHAVVEGVREVARIAGEHGRALGGDDADGLGRDVAGLGLMPGSALARDDAQGLRGGRGGLDGW